MKDTTTFNRNGKALPSHTICIDAANGICETVRVMEASYGLYRFSSAVVFMSGIDYHDDHAIRPANL